MSHNDSHLGQHIVIVPAPPRPPAGYDVNYMNQLNRWLENLSSQLSAITFGRFNGIYLSTDFQTSGYGLKPGEVFANAGILTVVRENEIWVGSVSSTGSVGTLTVSV